MLKRTMLIKITVTVFALAAIVGLAAVANSAAGSNADPLVTLSYINGTYKTQLLSEAESAAEKRQSELASALASQITALKSTLSQKKQTPASNPYQSISLEAGGSHSVPAGAQILFLSGAASVSADCLTDATEGKAVASQAALTENHLYLASGECLITASGSAKFLIRP